MTQIDSLNSLYSTYAKAASANKTNAAKKNDSVASTGKADKADKVTAKAEDKLSDKAKKLLDSLRTKYSGYDLQVADYKTSEEANAILSKSDKDFAVLFTSSELEKMANDDEYSQKVQTFIEDSAKTLQEAVAKLNENDDSDNENGVKSADIKRLGISFDGNGKISYFADLVKSTESANDKAADIREEKAEEKKAEAKKAEKKEAKEKAERAAKEKAAEESDKTEETSGTTVTVNTSKNAKEKKAFLTADTMDDLLKQLSEFDWSKVKATPVQAGKYIDFYG